MPDPALNLIIALAEGMLCKARYDVAVMRATADDTGWLLRFDKKLRAVAREHVVIGEAWCKKFEALIEEAKELGSS